MGKMLIKAILCAVGGVIGWLLTEPFMPQSVTDPAWAGHERLMVFLICALIGMAAGAFTGLQKGSQRHVLISTALGTALGAAGGMFGYQVGSLLVAGLFGSDIFIKGGPLPIVMVARALAATFAGLFLGGAVGLTNLSGRGVVTGAIGGVLGGAAAGFLFDPVSFFFAPLKMLMTHGNEVGSPGRAALALLLGFFVGLFTGILDILTRQAWVRLEVGKNEGREWPLDAAQTTIGRDERAMVPLFGDNNVAPLHAVIAKTGSQYVLHDPGSPLGVGMNGVRLSGPVTLTPGDTFQVGSHTLRFLTKGTAAAHAPERRVAAIPVGGISSAPYSPPGASSAPYTPPGASNAPYTPPGSVSMPSNGAAKPITLVVTAGPLTGQRFPIQAVLEVGREATGVALRGDSQASRRHASFTPTAAGVALQDLGSTNGTRVNGQVVTSAILKSGDVVQIGASSFRIE